MSARREKPEQIRKRLLKVLSQAQIKIYDDEYAFEEFTQQEFSGKMETDALAFVRDGDVWSQLVVSNNPGKKQFKVIGFHFKNNHDNSGFIGWLATHLKLKLGTGLFVICGHNSKRGGIYDFWGFPVDVADSVIEEIKKLINRYHIIESR
jgi:hypothetical protein